MVASQARAQKRRHPSTVHRHVPRSVAVHGAGIAGLAGAHEFERRGRWIPHSLPETSRRKQSFVDLLEKSAPASKLTEVIIHELSVFNLGKTVDFNFLSRRSVGSYCRSLGFATNRN